jgi:AAA15 family ATPase/GTPase
MSLTIVSQNKRVSFFYFCSLSTIYLLVKIKWFMFVKRLEVENIRSFKYFEIELSKGINVIAGANNAGKSTVLKSLYLLQESYTFRDQDLRINTPHSAIRIILDDISKKDALLFQNPSKGAPMLPTLPVAEVLFPKTLSNTNDAYYANTEVIYNDSLKELTLDQRRERYKDNFPYFPNFENKGNFIYPFFARRRGGFLSSSAKDNAYHVLDDYRNLPSKVQKVSNQRITKERFAMLCNEILGFEVGVYQGENGENRIAVHVGYSDRIPLESMGEGTANILGLITLLLTEDNKLFLLEELENDIHPLALKKLLTLIIEKSINNQFVISTHSNIILKYLGADSRSKIFFTEWDFDKTKTGEDLPTSSISEITNSPEKRLEILERLGYELFDYDLYKGYIIFEESSAEKIILELIIPQFVPELNDKIRTVASQGINDVISKLHTLSSLFMYLHRNEIYRNKAWVIVDGDAEGKKVIKELKERYATWDESHFLYFDQPYFEMYYPDRFKEEVTNVMKLKNGLAKQESKKVLLQSVLNWIDQRPEEAINEFQQSALEVILKLKTIATSF